MTRTISTALAALALLSLSAGTLVHAQTATTKTGGPVGVRDKAGMFSADTVKNVDQTLRDLRSKTHWSVAIETVDTIGDKTIKEAALENARRLQEHGLYILIAKKEHKFYVEPSNSARKAFSHDAINAIDDAITAGFKAKDFDKGLRDAVALIQHDAEATPDRSPTSAVAPANANATPPAPPRPRLPGPDEPTTKPVPPAAAPAGGEPEGSVLPILLIGGGAVLLVLFLISRAFRGPKYQSGVPPQGLGQAGMGGGYAPPGQAGPGPGYARPPQPQPQPQQRGYGPPPPQAGYGYGPPPPQQGGGAGGGFLSGVLGGAAGAVAGNILYDKFGHPHEAPGVPQQMPGGVIPGQGSTWPPSGAGADAPAPPAETYDPNAGGGGDWGTTDADPAQAQSDAEAGAGGDWGTTEPEPDAGAGGDWGGGGNDDAGAGGDWGGGGNDDPGTSDDQGGSW